MSNQYRDIISLAFACERRQAHQSLPASFVVLLVGFLKPGGGLDCVLINIGATLTITDFVQRSNDIETELGSLVNHHIDEVFAARLQKEREQKCRTQKRSTIR